MRIALIAFTKDGGDTCKRIADKLSRRGEMCLAYGTPYALEGSELIPINKTLAKWTKETFENSDAIVFVGATGIAVRAIAPYIKSKDKDPAIVNVDEKGKFCISLLSGHLGGANELAQTIALEIGAVAVITTATDINGKFAVDVWAKSQNLQIANLKAAKQVSADLLNGKNVSFYFEGKVTGTLPDGLEAVDAVTLKEKIDSGATCIIVTEKTLDSLKGREKYVLQLIPKNISIGMGCKKDISYKKVLDLFEKQFTQLQIRQEAILNIASIELKKDEKALIKLAEKLKVPFVTYTGEELMQVPGEFTESSFVRSITGVENVCERAACAAGEGSILLKKQALDGVTIAVAKREIVLDFGE